jgi:hypothetical protein
MNSQRLIWAAALCFALARPFTAHAQEVSISGTITDATDAALPGATVTAVHIDTGHSALQNVNFAPNLARRASRIPVGVSHAGP